MVDITLQTPIKRKDEEIKKLTLRKPMAGELRGLSLAGVMQMNVSAIITLAPRVASPALTEDEVAGMDPVDFAVMAQELVGFFFSAGAKAQMQEQLNL